MKNRRESLQQMRRRILERDGWRCQRCGSLTDLHVHHLQFRSRGGTESEANLITLCARCHAREHQGESRVRDQADVECDLHM